MANQNHLKILRQGVAAWNEFQEQLPRRKPSSPFANLGPDLIDADLSELDLSGANFWGGRLMGADFLGATLDRADFHEASIGGAHLTGTSLTHANFENGIVTDAHFDCADLTNANFKSADLLSVIFDRTKLEGVDFSGCEMGYTSIIDCDLSNVRGLEGVTHIAPTHIDIDTIYKSRGRIPESFLRGCGIPENFITHMHSLVSAEDGIQFFSCFISYSTKDVEFAWRLHGQMRDVHLRVWFAPEDIQGGKKLHEQIETAIRVYDKLLIILSEASLQSEWVMTELRKARKVERQTGKRKLFPVRLVDFDTLRGWECFDSECGKDLAIELREYFIPDFSNWKDHDSFEAAFARLLQDLKAEMH